MTAVLCAGSNQQEATEKLGPLKGPSFLWSSAAFYFVNPKAEVRVLTHRAHGDARCSTRSHIQSEG